jgi:murein DD-endopeptidase MepM/ murein hydrolase activator NlpD
MAIAGWVAVALVGTLALVPTSPIDLGASTSTAGRVLSPAGDVDGILPSADPEVEVGSAVDGVVVDGPWVHTGTPGCQQAPVPVDGAEIIDPFRAPLCRWCAGNRGIEFSTPMGAPVRSVTSGRVDFVGAVAGTRYVVVVTASGRRITYGGVAEFSVGAGSLVAPGDALGVSGERLHLGVRRGEHYEDPAIVLSRMARVRLVSMDGFGRRAHRCSADS